MPACGGSIRIATARLDRAGRAYEAHLRAQRLLRAGVSAATVGLPAVAITFVLVVPLFYFIPGGEEPKISLVSSVAFCMVVLGLFATIAYLNFWMLRAFTAGSLRAAWIFLVLLSLGAASQVAGLLEVIFNFDR